MENIFFLEINQSFNFFYIWIQDRYLEVLSVSFGVFSYIELLRDVKLFCI